ncbi:MAG: BMP family protein [Malacoplasma sp.]|nr:BMP family protein [Malacoplasma sp.]
MFNKKWNISKFGSIVIIAGFATAFATSCSPLTYQSPVQLIVSDNTSTLADQSFSQSSYDGMTQFVKDVQGVTLPDSKSVRENSGLWKRPGEDDESRRTAYKYAVLNGSNLIVATGYNQQNALQQITSTLPQYADWKNFFDNHDVGFIFVDGAMTGSADGTIDTSVNSFASIPNNVSSISYRADDGSFLAGIATCVYLNLYKNDFMKGVSQTGLGVSGFVGLALPSTLSYLSGFRLGVHYWNQILQPLIKDTVPIHWVNPNSGRDTGGNINDFVSTSFNANEPKATILTKDMRQNGANAVFPIAGPQTSLVVSEISSDSAGEGENLARAIAIGVDSAQEEISSLATKFDWNPGQSIGYNNQILPFSSIKNLTSSVAGVLEAVVDNQNNKDSAGIDGWKGLGWNNVGTIANGSVGISDAGLQYVIDPFFWVDSTTAITTDALKTWSNTKYTYGNVSLQDLISNDRAKALSPDDNVIKRYGELLTVGDNAIVTPQSISNNGSTITLQTQEDSASLNGPLGDGKWGIYNNANGVNNFLTLNLSKFLPGITGGEYPVASPNAEWVGGANPTAVAWSRAMLTQFKKT